MSGDLLSAREAARRLGITPATLYGWFSQSDRGLLVLRGRSVTVHYFQGGPRGQGQIRIEAAEIERLLDCLRVKPQPAPSRRTPYIQPATFPGITVPLGRP